MSGGERVPLDEALGAARGLAYLIKDACVRVEIAGSIRRQKPTIGDIDLVVEPFMANVFDMFGEASGEMANLTDERLDELVAIEKIGKRLDKNGRPPGRAVEAGHVQRPERRYPVGAGPADVGHVAADPHRPPTSTAAS